MNLMCLLENAARNAICKVSIVRKTKESNGFSSPGDPITSLIAIMHSKAS